MAVKNCTLSGSIPSAALLDYDDIEVLRLEKTGITGTVPTQLGQLQSLTSLDLSGNLLNGQIPSQITSHPALKLLDLHDNRLSGAIPSFQGSSIEDINLVCVSVLYVWASRPLASNRCFVY